MRTQQLNWKRPLFYVFLPVFLGMACVGLPVPVAPPPATRPPQEQTVTVKKKKKRLGLFVPESDADAGRDDDGR
jgi:hypothetical protein